MTTTQTSTSSATALTFDELKHIALRAGVEHEFILVSDEIKEKVKDFKDQSKQVSVFARKEFATMLKGIERVMVDDPIAQMKLRSDSKTYETMWTLPYESCLIMDRQPRENEFEIELASPVAKIQSGGWIKQTEDIYNKCEEKNYKIRVLPKDCATQVHISPSEGDWNVEALKSIAKAIVYFERCVDKVVQHCRLKVGHCGNSNFASVLYQSKVTASSNWESTWKSTLETTLNTMWDRIDACSDVDDIAKLMCTLVKGSRTTTVTGFTHVARDKDELDREFRWNFRPLINETDIVWDRKSDSSSPHVLGTIEFRQPEGSKTAEQAIGWRLFAAGFVQAAICLREYKQNLALQRPTVADLRDFVKEGLRIMDRDGDWSRVSPMFVNKVGLSPSEITFSTEGGFKRYDVG